MEKRDSFEDAADFLLIAAPVSIPEYNMNHTVSAVVDLVDDGNNFVFEIGDVGKTGVELRYYSRENFKKLPQDQRDELASWNLKRKV